MGTKISELPEIGTLTGQELLPIVSNGENYSCTVQQISGGNANYFFHGFAGNQILGDAKFYDISGNFNDGTFGANLSNANAWANDGYVSTVNPTGGSTDSVIRLPSFNLDYAGGESFIIWWLGKATAEGSNVNAIGDGFNSTYHGLNIRVAATTGQFTLGLSDASNYFGGTSTGTPFDGNLHSFAVALNGGNRSYAYWVDDALDAATSIGFTSYNSGTSIDTTTTNTFNIGSSLPASASSTNGMVMQTRAFVLMKLAAGVEMPTAATLTSVFKSLRRNPSKLVLASVFA